jgi:hypothetical protein
VAEKQTRQQTLDRVLAAKQLRRRKLAQLSFEEKILMVLQMQKVSRQLKQGQPKR